MKLFVILRATLHEMAQYDDRVHREAAGMKI